MKCSHLTGRVRARYLNDTGYPGVYIKWEKPTKAILDYFTLDNVTLLGISMGGYLCVRAAAFSPLKLHYKQLEALKNAKSVTGRIFTKKEQAQKYCQIRKGISGSHLA